LIKPQARQVAGYELLLEMKRSGKDMSNVERDSFTCMCGDEPIFCAGFIEMDKDNAVVWAVFDKRVKPNIFLSIHRQVCAAIKAYQPSVFSRLEMTVLDGFEEAHRWAKMLGFVHEAYLEKHGPLSQNHTQYKRIR
jgi:hypothetical protein